MTISTVYPGLSTMQTGAPTSNAATSNSSSAVAPSTNYSSDSYVPTSNQSALPTSNQSALPTSNASQYADPSQVDPSQMATDPSQAALDPSQQMADPSQMAVDPSQQQYVDPSQQQYADPSAQPPVVQGQPVAPASTGSHKGFLFGAIGGALASWRFLLPKVLPMIGKSGPVGLVTAGVVGVGGLVGGWLLHKVIDK